MAVVVDNGSGMLKAGFSGEEFPRAVIPSIIGRTKMNTIREKYIASEARSMRGILKIKYPIEHGIVRNWDDMEKIWRTCFEDELRIQPHEYPFLLTEAPLNPTANRDKMAEVMFESFSIPALYIGVQAVLSLYGTGRLSGQILDSGDGVTHIVPIYGGYKIDHAIYRLDLAGRDLSSYLTQLLLERGHSFTSSAERDIVRDMKEKLCYVAQDYRMEIERSRTDATMEKHYELPDGNVITMGSERFRCPEALFDSSVLGMQLPGIHESLYESIKKCDTNIRRVLSQNIVLSGGTTMFPGIVERLQRDLQCMLPQNVKVVVNATPSRKFAVWRGGSVLAAHEQFVKMCVTRREYKEYGPNILQRKM